MRTKSDERRQAIIEHAAAIFRETGFARASMAQIAARVGGSKTTLYGYFRSKEELFATVMCEEVGAHSRALGMIIDGATDDPRTALLTFGRAYLDHILSPNIIAIMRVGIAESDTNGIGPTLYGLGPRRGWGRIADHLQGWIDRGLLRPGRALSVALHLRGLLEAGIVEPRLYGADPVFDLDEAVADATDAFLRIYAA